MLLFPCCLSAQRRQILVASIRIQRDFLREHLTSTWWPRIKNRTRQSTVLLFFNAPPQCVLAQQVSQNVYCSSTCWRFTNHLANRKAPSRWASGGPGRLAAPARHWANGAPPFDRRTPLFESHYWVFSGFPICFVTYRGRLMCFLSHSS